MEAVLQPPPRRADLLLHCGAHAVDREVIGSTPTPEPTTTWTPLPHMALIQEGGTGPTEQWAFRREPGAQSNSR